MSDLLGGHAAGPAGVEWPHSLDLAALWRSGWRPHPIRQIVLKVHSRCNLRCDYCYVYTSVDQSWRSRPIVMSAATVRATAERIAEHAATHAVSAVTVILHGGEPLLAGRERLRATMADLRRIVGPVTELRLRVQTNGSLLDQGFLADFRRHDARVGVSVDGTATAHDRHRRHANGRGSYADVARGLRLLRRPENRQLYSGILCTIDLRHDPVATYEALLAHEPPAMNFLLPHHHWSDPPPRPDPAATAPYADWLIAVFDRWYDAPIRETRIRLFDSILDQLLGGRSVTEVLGLTPSTVLVVETDGHIEQSDVLKTTTPGAPWTGLTVTDHSFDDALRTAGLVARQLGAAALSEQCQGCRVRDICGGGFYPHRYLRGQGFRNPSVYCADLFRLITHVAARLGADLSRPVGT